MYGWPTHAVRLAATLFRYLVGGHYTDALTVQIPPLFPANKAIVWFNWNLGHTYVIEEGKGVVADTPHQKAS